MTRIIQQQSPEDGDLPQIIERPDGFYWIDKVTGKDFGPFQTLLEAVLDEQSSAESALDTDETLGETIFEPGETLEEAEAEIGISDWVDPDTGEPGEEARAHIRDDH